MRDAEKFYRGLPERVAAARSAAGQPLCAAEKVLFTHLFAGPAPDRLVRGETYLDFWPDFAAMQDALAQMALLQFILTERDTRR